MERWRHKLILRARSLFRRTRVEAELEEELRFHVEQQIQQLVARGLSPAEARRTAMIRLGGVERQKEACRDARGVNWIEHAIRDVRYGARVLRSSPGFTAVAVMSLALGIGANTAIFELVDAVRLRKLPVVRAEELADIRIAGGIGGWGVSEDSNSQITYPLWEQIREHQRAFSGVFAWGTAPFLIGTGADARMIRGLWVSGEAFSVLRVSPAVGRLFGPADDQRGCAPSVVLDYAFWQSAFGGDPLVVGRTLTVLARPVPIVGVTSKEFFGLEVGKRFDIALPTCAAAAWGSPLDRRDWFWLSAMGRLRDGWTIARAADDLSALSPGLFDATLPSGRDSASLDRYRRFRLTAVAAATGVSGLRTTYGDALWLLLAMTALVLLMACTNLMNLLLARANAREQEIALRVAIGASRARVISQLLVESLLVAGCGAALGAAIAGPLSRGILTLVATENDPLHLELHADWRVLAFAAAVGAATCVVFGLTPALRASKQSPGTAIKAGARGLTTTREHALIQRGLIAAQVALSLILMVGAVLFVRSFRNLVTLDTGLAREGVIVARFADFSDRPTPDRVIAEQQELLERVRTVPGVDFAATTTKLPLDSSSWTLAFVLPDSDRAERGASKFTYVSPQYFNAVGMRLLTGRDFTNQDRASSPQVAVVNQTFVDRYLGGTNPVGRTIRTVAEPRFPERTYQIAGVVGDTKYADLREPRQPITFVPIAQHPSPRPWPNMVIRTSASPGSVIHGVKQAVVELHPNMTSQFRLLDTQVREGLVRERLLAWLAGGFGVLATLLAVIGVYGVVSYLVLRRRHELAIRLALGAGRARVVTLIVKDLAISVFAGLAVGAPVAAVATRGASGLLFGLSSHDAATFVSSMAALAGVAALACLVPALSASRVDPNTALRTE